MVLVCGRALAAAFLPQKSLGASFHSSCSKIIDSNVVSLGNLPGSCAQGPPGSEATEGCSQPHGSVQICRFQAQPHAQEWQGGIFSTLPKWDPSPNPSPPSLPWLQPPLNRQQSCPMQPGQGRFMHCCCPSSVAQLGLALADRNPWGCSQHQRGPLFPAFPDAITLLSPC